MKKKVFSMLALLIAVVTGAWAQEPDPINLTSTNGKEWTLTEMPAYDVELEVEYETDLALSEATDNSAALTVWNGYEADVTLTRTLYKDGDWNTICLPFNVDLTADGCPLAGAEALPLSTGSISGTTLTLNFGAAVTTLQAGVPYIIRWDKANDYVDNDAHNIVNPVFSGVTIDKGEHIYDNQDSGDARVRFVGTYKNTTFNSEDKSILLLGAGSTLYYPKPDGGQYPSIGAFRAYFKIGENGALTRGITSFDINYGDGTTGIETITNNREPITDGTWYTLDGRKLSGKPTAKGLYIVNGRKVVVK